MSQRTQRLADQIQRDLSVLIREEIKDPRIRMVTISGVKVSPDMGYADVYVTVLGATLEEKPDEAQKLLQTTDRIIRGFPEVEQVLGKAGRAETATDPAPLSMIETVIQLHPPEKWPKVHEERWQHTREEGRDR